MRKFLAYSAIAWQENIAYKAEKILWTVINIGGVIPIISLWLVLGQTGVISPQTSHYLSAYYLVTIVISRLTGSDLEEWLIDDIKDGTISRDIIRPYPFFLNLFARDLVWRMSYIFYISPLIILLFFIATPVKILYLFLFILAIYFQRALIAMIIAFTAFWIDQSSALTHLKWMLGSLLSGSLLPLAFFPQWFQNIARWTPFWGWAYFPAQVVLNQASTQEIFFGVSSLVVWAAVILFIAKHTWEKGIVRFSSVGG
jgi:ABC-2 type transport system permease protein